MTGHAQERRDDDLEAFRAAQRVLGSDVHRHLEQRILNARPIPPADRQVAARPPIDVVAWLVWEKDGLQVVETRATGWAGRDVLVGLRDTRWPVLGVWLPSQDVRRR